MANNQRFLYEVHPQKAIMIPGQRPVRRPFTNLLTKDEVLEYMKSGRVYRKFSGTEMVLVTGENINRLHHDSQQAEEAVKTKESKPSPFSNFNKEPARGTVSIGASQKPEESVEEDKKETDTEENTEDTKEEQPVSQQTQKGNNNRNHNRGSKKK